MDVKCLFSLQSNMMTVPATLILVSVLISNTAVFIKYGIDYYNAADYM